MRHFPIGAVLSVVGDKLMCEIGGLYKILNYMTSDNLFTHQLPRASSECRPALLRQYPKLAGFDDSAITPENVHAEIQKAIDLWGETLPVVPLWDAALNSGALAKAKAVEAL